ncbi:hypothetical protein EGW08_003493 [Elysia chlorotica]|uniref:Cadherin domain-containing protein n=1 Tax=Elysia chlorotica TaxID=188477 RepID=A0A3S0ZXZ2_ELYCH|nr:hypothetical protein EGW08_003493 [Elysia chlorotica]
MANSGPWTGQWSVTDQQTQADPEVTVRIQDENDNAPVFVSSVFDVTVSESAKAGSSVAWVLVSDSDTGGGLALSLTGPDAGMFRIEQDVSESAKAGSSVAWVLVSDSDTGGGLALSLTGPDVGMFRIEQDGTVRTNQALDYETRRRHLLTVVATDGVHTSRARLDIHVRDENDHSPQFGQAEYSFEVSEGARPGHTIGQVSALDLDSGKNGRVVYGLVSEWGQEYFLLDAVHGTFTLVKELDFEDVSTGGKEGVRKGREGGWEEGRESVREGGR